MTLILLILVAIVIYYVFIYKDSFKKNMFNNDEMRCPNCKNPIERNYNVCPICKETLKKKCMNCGEMVDSHWRYCPYCESTVRKSESIEE